MAFYQFVCASTVMIVLLSGGCHSQQPVCGRAMKNTSIGGGGAAAPGSWPWLVSLNNYGYHFCSGSLINNQWVLTAAHCLSGKDRLTTMVSLGRLNQLGQNFSQDTKVSRGLEKIVCHHSSNYYDDNICLLKLSAPVNFTDYIQPVCLASAGSTFHNVSSYVTGFGRTQAGSYSGADILQEVKVPIVGNNECRCPHRYITDNMICAAFGEGGKDACQGDGGAPLVTNNGLMWIQSGVKSVGYRCNGPAFLGEFTRVSQYQDWITSIIDSSQTGFVTYNSSGVDSDLTFNCTRDGRDFGSDFDSDFDSIFASGENVVHLSHLTSLCLLVLSLSVLV
ncbi:hypothetical protein VZT92_017356 [Zoarces viviparus]|uniref:Peptidase S1 domain-containing protein n=1 Tax=Zoarces viviparus TaxID=48416 RepID=A0AAW1ERW7_ZOAVI